MSRIQDILSKAERDGTARRTRALPDEYASRPVDEGMSARGFVDTAPAPRAIPDEGRSRTSPVELPHAAPAAPPVAPDAPRPARARRVDGPASPAPAERRAEAELPPSAARTTPLEGSPRSMAK